MCCYLIEEDCRYPSLHSPGVSTLCDKTGRLLLHLLNGSTGGVGKSAEL